MKYPVYQPSLLGNELKYVTDCIESSWISSKGKYVQLFEQQFADYIGVPNATAVCNGTVALHLALLALNVKPGDEVIVPTLTYIATVNAITYVGATPVFCDSLADSWQMDPEDVKRKITPKTKAIIAVHLYGQACDMTSLQAICKDNGIFMIEDCAEAIGTTYNNSHVGTFGDVATFSFFGNKTITTGEGGMVVSHSKEIIDLVYYLKNQGVSKTVYWHDLIGYNYKMTNICAAIGLAQLERLDEILADKARISECYRKAFKNTAVEFHATQPGTRHSYWMNSILIPDGAKRETLRDFLLEKGIETRPLFYPVHSMPMYETSGQGPFPVVANISLRGLNLPSYPALTNEDVAFIADAVKEFIL